MIPDIVAEHIKSYKDLPRMMYHIQWKFRDEVRPRFGVMRGREFLMKDAYSFDISPEAGRISYNKQFVAYLRLYARMGLKAIPMAADTGPIGGDMSHEFIILAETGESQVWCDTDLLKLDLLNMDIDHRNADQMSEVIGKVTSFYAATDEMHDEAKYQAEVPADRQMTARGIEVGHIFFFGDKYSDPMNAKVQTADGGFATVQSGSYGVGVSRLLGAIIEACHDDNGIIWPEEVAPFKVGLINLRVGDAACDAACEDFYAKIQAAGVDVLYDDRDTRAGVKFADMDLIGLPWQVVIGPKGVANGIVELKSRKTGEKEELSPEAAVAKLSGSKPVG